MRAQARNIRHEEEEESAFVSMTDMTVGFLFIMMILLAFFASQMREPDAVSRPEHDAVISERDKLSALVQKQNAEIAKLESVNEKLEAELITIAAKVDELTLQSAEKENLLQRLKSSRNLWRTTAISRAETITKLEANANELQIRLAEMTDKTLELLQIITEQKSEIQRLIAELETLKRIDPLEEYLAQVASVRRTVLMQLRDAIRLDYPELQVELSEESDALRFQGEGLFASGRSSLTTERQQIVGKLAQRLDEVLPCFTIGQQSAFSENCNPGFVMIEAVQIEGHTDDVGTDRFNRTLSTNRANNTFFAMSGAAPTVIEHRNLKFQPVLSVAAYGPDRPITTNDTANGRATNRRIDLRFIMVSPPDTDGITAIRKALQTVSGGDQ